MTATPSSGQQMAFMTGMDVLQKTFEVLITSMLGPKFEAFKEFQEYMIFTTTATMEALGHNPNSRHRGMSWEPFSENSFGRLRPSGKKITPDSALLQDTGTLLAESAASVFSETPEEFIFGTGGAAREYGRDQQEGIEGRLPARPYLFVTNRDGKVFAEMLSNFIFRGVTI